MLFGFVTNTLGTKYGIHYLFLYPEYLDQVNAWSFAIFGFSVGGFISAFNVYSYIRNGTDFPFIVTLSRPFYKYSINNFILPATFVLIWLYQSAHFQSTQELLSTGEILLNFAGFFMGLGVFFILSMLYFFRTNKDIYKISGKDQSYFDSLAANEPVDTTFHRGENWYKRLKKMRLSRQGWRVETYLSSPLKIRLARSSFHYDPELLKRVFLQNHINASIFEIVLFLTFICIGVFQDHPAFSIPAGASILVLLTMGLMLLSALRSWFKTWTTSVLFVAIVLFSIAVKQFDFLQFKNPAYGLNYQHDPAPYTFQNLQQLASDSTALANDYAIGIQSLENWKSKFNEEKPYIVIVNSSGGGLRSALWTFNTLAHLDSLTDGRFFDHVQFSTGASGGLIGNAYYRELKLRQKRNELTAGSLKAYSKNICKDLLNPVALSVATNDFFIRLGSCTDGKYNYTKDRGYIFEEELNENTQGIMNRKLGEYRDLEASGEIPLLVICPVIINDSRRLLISAQPMSYLCHNLTESGYQNSIDLVEYRKLFKHHDPDNLKFTSALRMGASFPYILPNVTFPSEPQIAVMDAGIRDNLGVKTSTAYLSVFRKWIIENTSGVIFLQIRDTKKHFEEISEQESLPSKLSSPWNTLKNFTKVQDYNNDLLLRGLHQTFGSHFIPVTIELSKEGRQNASLSFHLTRLEKKLVLEEIHSSKNQEAIEALVKLLQP